MIIAIVSPIPAMTSSAMNTFFISTSPVVDVPSLATYTTIGASR
jgi:hypothetical protein